MKKTKQQKIKLQASEIYRVGNCPGSLYLSRDLDPVYKFNPWAGKASLGSLLHNVAERRLLDGYAIPTLLNHYGLDRGTPDYDKGLHTVKYYEKTIKHVEKQRKKLGGEMDFYIEYKFRKTVADVECVAKMDYMIITETMEKIFIDIFDLKTGSFDYTESARDQLFFSLLVVLASLYKISDKRKVHYTGHVVQPNYWEEEDRHIQDYQVWDMCTLIGRLRTENIYIKETGENYFNSGKWCKFCPAILACRKSQGIFENLEELTGMGLEGLQPARLEEIYLKAEHVKDYLKNVEGVILQLMEKGTTFEKCHKKQTSGHRRYKDEKAVKKKLKHLGDDIYKPRELKTPAQLEKLAGAKNLDDLVEKSKFFKLVLEPRENPFKDFKVGEGE